jgi:hypothetical protein
MINILLLIIFKFQVLLQLNQPLEEVWEAWVELHLLLEDFNLLISKWVNRIIKWEPWEVAWAKWEEA